MMQSILPDQILKLKGKDLLEIVDNMKHNHDELVEQNRKLQELFALIEKKIICYQTCIELVNSLIDKAVANENPDVQASTNDCNDWQEEVIMPDNIE